MTANPAYSFRATARGTSAGRGVVEAESESARAAAAPQIAAASTGAPPIEFSAPPEFHGDGGYWTPEHFLVAAVAACFLTTFRAIAGLAKFAPEALKVQAEGVVEKTEGGYRFTRVRLRPVLTIRPEQDQEQAARLLEKAARSCLVSHSLRSELEFAPVIQVVAPVEGRTRQG